MVGFSFVTADKEKHQEHIRQMRDRFQGAIEKISPKAEVRIILSCIYKRSRADRDRWFYVDCSILYKTW